MTQFEHNLLATLLATVTGIIITKNFPIPGEREYWEEKMDKLFEK